MNKTLKVIRHVGRLERYENEHWNEVFHLYYPAGTEDYWSADKRGVMIL